MLTIFITKPSKANYTPSSLMIEWARLNGVNISRSKYGELLIDIAGNFKYDHWEITQNGDGSERVALHLTKAVA